MTDTGEPIDRALLAGPAPEVAPRLLNRLLVSRIDRKVILGRITEVEAYTQDDPASHTFRGRTARNGVMFGPAGHLYVYLSYGIHFCANVVTGPEGRGEAVLLRALAIEGGIEHARRRRAGRPDRELADGPGKLCAALGIDRAHDGLDVVTDDGPLGLFDDGVAPPQSPRVGPRIGITKAVDTPWRFRI